MASEKHYNAEEKIEVARKICELYGTGNFTIDSCCENQAITNHTFLRWCGEVVEISELYKEAKQKAAQAQRTELRLAALNSLKKLVDGYSVDEIHQSGTPIYDKDKNIVGNRTTSIKRITKHYQPNVTAVIFSLKAMDPHTFKDNIPEVQNQEQVFLIDGKEVRF